MSGKGRGGQLNTGEQLGRFLPPTASFPYPVRVGVSDSFYTVLFSGNGAGMVTQFRSLRRCTLKGWALGTCSPEGLEFPDAEQERAQTLERVNGPAPICLREWKSSLRVRHFVRVMDTPRLKLEVRCDAGGVPDPEDLDAAQVLAEAVKKIQDLNAEQKRRLRESLEGASWPSSGVARQVIEVLTQSVEQSYQQVRASFDALASQYKGRGRRAARRVIRAVQRDVLRVLRRMVPRRVPRPDRTHIPSPPALLPLPPTAPLAPPA